MRSVLRQLRRAVLLSGAETLSDSQLLNAFLAHRDEAAFDALLRRHGPMVMGVCRRMLRNTHDAEDAFQATFLVLARKAESIRTREVLASWLYGVAYRTASQARKATMKRREKERATAYRPSRDDTVCEELLEQLDRELNRLPEKYRVPVVLCELECRSRREAARMLGLAEGTLSWRLAHAKKLLARRLSRYGTVAVAALLAEGVASARLSPTLFKTTAQTVLKAGSVPATILTLTEGVLKTMLLTKLKITFCTGCLMLVAGIGATGLTYRVTAQEPRQGTALASRPQADDLESIRLKMEVLRKEVRALRDRLKVVEEQSRVHNTATTKRVTVTEPKEIIEVPSRVSTYTNIKKEVDDPLAAAEAALAKLRKNPGDKEAAEALERALHQLKAKERGTSDPFRRDAK